MKTFLFEGSRKSRKSWLVDLLLLCFLLAIFFGYGLGSRALWSPIEGRYAEIAREMLVSHDYVTLRLAGTKFFDKPPFFIWLECAAIGLLGLNEWSLRLWPALFAELGCLAVYIAGRKLFDRRTGWLAAIVLATSGLWYALSHIVSLDMTVSVLLSCCLLSFLLATQESSEYRRRWFMWTFYILTALASLTKGLIAIVFPALIIGSWIMLSGEWSILSSMYLPSGILLLLLIALPWHVLVARANPGFLSHYFIHGQFQRYLTPRDGPVPGPMTFIPVLLVGLFPWSAFLPQALRNSLRSSLQDIRQRKGVIFLFLWALLVFLFFSCSRYQDIPYILPAFPPMAILIARYFGKIWNNRASWSLRSGSWILLVALGLMTMVSVIAPQHYLERYSNWPTLEVPSEEGSIVSTRLTQYPDLGALTPYIPVQTTILVIGTVTVLLVWMRRRGFPWCFSTVALSWAVFLVAVGSSLAVLDQRRSIKPLAIELGAILQPVDEVATYHTYYQDLPVYLRRPVTIVNWRGELQFEVNLQNTATSWAIDDATFWKRWEGLQRIYLLVDRTKFEQLSHDLRHKFFLVTETNYDVLLSNKDTLPTYAAPAVNGIRSG